MQLATQDLTEPEKLPESSVKGAVPLVLKSESARAGLIHSHLTLSYAV